MRDSNALVSILCPCYNSEIFVERMLNSVLNQTYKNIELICIDDGSTDGTVSVINRYASLFEKESMKLICLEKEHAGQAAAINYGLKFLKGEYFCLIDSDDFLVDTSIEKRVNVLEQNKDYAVVVSDYYIVKENQLDNVIGKGNDYIGNLKYQPYQFQLAIVGLSSITPIGYMIRTEDMKKINPDMEIDECIEGQNYQILLPLYYSFNRCFIDEALAYYVIRDDSHDHISRTRSEQIIRYKNLLKMMENVLNDLGLPESEIVRYKRNSIFYKNMEAI